MELPDGYRGSKNPIVRLQKAKMRPSTRGVALLEDVRDWAEGRGSERCQADPYVFRRSRQGCVVVIMVLHVDDLLLLV